MELKIRSSADLKEIFEKRKGEMKEIFDSEVKKLADEIFERESELFEFNLFISSIGNEEIEKANKNVEELREKNLDLSEYEDMAEDF